MKYLLVALVVLVAVWVWRSNRARDEDEDSQPTARAHKPRPSSAAPAEMVACRHCGVHLPAGEALAGRLGAYCSAEHRRLNEGV